MKKPIPAIGGATGLVVLTLAIAPPSLHSPDGASARQAPQTAAPYNGPRTPDRKPDLNGIWQVLGSAHWNVEAHSASEGVPAGFSVVDGGTIPYQPWALAKRNENFQNRLMA